MSLVVQSRAAHGRPSRAAAEAPRGEYDFLLGRYIDTATLKRAYALAETWGVNPHDVLIANGWLDAEDYCRAIAYIAGVPFNAGPTAADTVLPAQTSPRQCLANGLLKERARARSFMISPERFRPNALRAVLARLAPSRFSLATACAVRAAIHHHFAPALTKEAVDALATRRPDMSARKRTTPWQRTAFVLVGLALFGALLLAPVETIRAVTLLLALLFVPVIGLRVIAALGLLRGGVESTGRTRVPDTALPTYTLLVPLYREAHMVPQIVKALTGLDWPAAKLDIKLVLEAVDTETITAAQALHLPGNVEIVIVPDAEPRTKPKALNYALPLARGEFIVIYDAEDRPERDQLRRAFDAFRQGPPNLATVQARLNVYNDDGSWLTRQFTLEYSALFDGLLPTLDRLDLPLPLGGTSNHFRVSALKWLMAWDPFNVTEDADLGTRLSRCGYRCRVLASTTYEEAPARLGNWFRQRSRWLKGFVQTWLVHMRKPGALWRELGPRGVLAFQVTVGGTILSALVHPWFYVLVAADAVGGGLLAPPASRFGAPLWATAWFALVAGYASAMALAFLAARRRGLDHLVWHIPLMPLYWLLISAAAYRALWQFLTAPFKWEKTEHGGGGQPPLR